jgi:hypothetical protein
MKIKVMRGSTRCIDAQREKGDRITNEYQYMEDDRDLVDMVMNGYHGWLIGRSGNPLTNVQDDIACEAFAAGFVMAINKITASKICTIPQSSSAV